VQNWKFCRGVAKVSSLLKRNAVYCGGNLPTLQRTWNVGKFPPQYTASHTVRWCHLHHCDNVELRKLKISSQINCWVKKAKATESTVQVMVSLTRLLATVMWGVFCSFRYGTAACNPVVLLSLSRVQRPMATPVCSHPRGSPVQMVRPSAHLSV